PKSAALQFHSRGLIRCISMISFLLLRFELLERNNGLNFSERRTLLVPLRTLLVGVSRSQDRHFIERLAD
ncbi:MAG TPA: hypothetical protein VF089_00200, partial [Candidatus Binatia bacterium]